jgi:hypothetical protein
MLGDANANDSNGERPVNRSAVMSSGGPMRLIDASDRAIWRSVGANHSPGESNMSTENPKSASRDSIVSHVDDKEANSILEHCDEKGASAIPLPIPTLPTPTQAASREPNASPQSPPVESPSSDERIRK